MKRTIIKHALFAIGFGCVMLALGEAEVDVSFSKWFRAFATLAILGSGILYLRYKLCKMWGE